MTRGHGRRPATARRPPPRARRTARASASRAMLYRRRVLTRARVAALGYVYAALGVPALALDGDHQRAAPTTFTVAAFAYLWFLGTLRALLIRFDPDGFFASV